MKNLLRLGGWSTDHLCAISKLSGLLSRRGLSHENCIIFWVSSQSTIRRIGLKNAQFSEGDRDGN